MSETQGDGAEVKPTFTQAATVVLVRDSTDDSGGTGGIEVLMLRRSDVGAFPGFWVFPGGRVDPTDQGDDEIERGRSAAAREAAEEVGAVVDLDAMITWSHWTPPAVQPRRFLTWFFVAPWKGDDIVIDGTEILEHRWMRPEAALAADLRLAPPTAITLVELRDKGVEGVQGLSRLAPPRYATKHMVSDDGPVLLWHPDAGYHADDPSLVGARFRLYYPTPDEYHFESNLTWDDVERAR